MKIKSRLDCEGISFLTKSLPKLGKAIDMALHSDHPLHVSGFRLRPDSAIPRFLGWLLEKIFTSDGYVRSDPDITTLRHIRQFLYFSYKLKLPYDKETESSVIESFIRTQEELHSLEFPLTVHPIIREARSFITRLFCGINVRDIIPRHGPGTVSTGEEVGEKSNFSRIYQHTEMMYPFTEYFMLGLNQVADQFDWIQSLESLPYGTACVVLVPKDSRGPRLISKEPLELQWIQQGIQKLLYSWIEKHPMTRGFVNFTDQSINRWLALDSSRTYQYVTLDMKDASDRVTLKLVERLFSGTPLYDALVASRSEFTQLPDGRVVRLSTFAPMGSAVCFPIEALCFYALAVAVLHIHYYKGAKHPPVYVYGDDIIVEREVYPLLLQYFPEVGLKFNLEKCCVAGSFRESCGCDAFRGVDVTPTRLRATWSRRRSRNAEKLVSYVELSNSLWEKGYWGSANYVKYIVESHFGLLPYTRQKYVYRDLAGHIRLNSSALIGWYRSHVNESIANRKRLKMRLHPEFQRVEYRNWIIGPKDETFDVDGWRECLRVMNTTAHENERDLLEAPSTHSELGVYALPHRICLRRGWAAA